MVLIHIHSKKNFFFYTVFTQTHTLTHQSQLWVQCLAQTCFSTQTGDAGEADLLATAATKLGLELGLGLSLGLVLQ